MNEKINFVIKKSTQSSFENNIQNEQEKRRDLAGSH